MSGTDVQTEATEQVEIDATRPASHRRGLLLIGLFKLSKSIFFFAVGIGALHLIHRDLGNEIMRLAQQLRFVDPESHMVLLLIQKADLIDAHKLREIGFGTFSYSALALVEGTGLMLEKVWAEYLTLGLTVAFLPWESFELIREPSWFRFGLLVTNLLVLVYLLWLLRKKESRRSERNLVPSPPPRIQVPKIFKAGHLRCAGIPPKMQCGQTKKSPSAKRDSLWFLLSLNYSEWERVNMPTLFPLL